jgi:hypothetical protein
MLYAVWSPWVTNGEIRFYGVSQPKVLFLFGDWISPLISEEDSATLTSRGLRLIFFVV